MAAILEPKPPKTSQQGSGGTGATKPNYLATVLKNTTSSSKSNTSSSNTSLNMSAATSLASIVGG